jgi:hypothetical protein
MHHERAVCPFPASERWQKDVSIIDGELSANAADQPQCIILDFIYPF